MIPAQHNKSAEALFFLYIIPAMRRHFHSIHLLGVEPDWPQNHPLLILPNHCSWWDGFFIYLLNSRVWRRKPYLMMLEEQLAQNRFFRYLGAYSVNSKNPGALRTSLRYTQEILSGRWQQNIMLCIFPQGELLPWQVRPLGYKPGMLWLLQNLNLPVWIVQMGIKIEFLLQQRPQVFIEFAEPLRYSDGEGTLEFWQQRHTRLLEAMDQKILHKEEGRLLLQGKKSVNTRWLQLRQSISRSKG